MAHRIGIDLGGTKIEIISLDSGGRPLVRRRVPAPRGDYGATLGALVSLVREIESETGQKGSLGIGIPGSLSSATGLVRNANSVWLIGKPLKQDLERELQREVRFANDANCFALSEAVDGAGRNEEVVFGVILGTGVGGGISIGKKVVEGRNLIAGEWGHNPLPGETDLHQCYCGRKGCLETYLSGPAFERDGRNLDRYHDRLARALGVVINILDPDVIVLGGGVSNEPSLYTEVPRIWARYIFTPEKALTRLVRAQHGDSSGVRGAAWLWPR